jgi:hypothetical protein
MELGMKRILIATVFVSFSALGYAQEIDLEHIDPKKASPEQMKLVNELMERRAENYMSKLTGDPNGIKSLIIKGNKITTIVYNYGSITRPNTLYNTADLVWNRLGYGFEFSPLVLGRVVDVNNDTVHILDDGLWLSTQGSYSPGGLLKWGWLPKAGYAAPSPNLDIAAWSHRSDVNGDLTRKPHSWPESWYNPTLGRYVWPAFLGNDATSPDEEVYFVCDDYTNAKYEYYPFPDDTTKRGLGLDLECRFFQFNNPLAEDIIFLVYRVTNRSPKTINKAYFGMYGDPHVGGGTSDYSDDLAYFIPPKGPLADPYPQRARSMVYAWDSDGKGENGIVPGYFGFKFLESPTNSENGIDDDDDGIIDESPFNDAGYYIDGVNFPLTTGIADTAKYSKIYGRPKARWSGDENGNWDPAKDDVGLDGIPGTGDFGEGNGKPDIGYDANNNLVAEPHFGIRDVNESDQIGLTTFYAMDAISSNCPQNDALYDQLLSSDSIAIDQRLFATPGDNIFVYGSGPFALAPNGTQRFSIALMMGENLPDLILNSETSQRILEANYQFAQPPPKPIVTAVPGNNRVTLYWDASPEKAIDPLTGTQDFEGYKVYRSEDYTFSDIYTITDANGSAFLAMPLLQKGKAAQFDVINQWSGLHPVEYQGRGIKYNLGTNSGLFHQYVDSSVTNGKTYYYAVASYDHGFDSLGIQLPPSECQITITRDPITGVMKYDQNTAVVTPGPLPSGMDTASVDHNSFAQRVNGISTGRVRVQILENYAVPDGGQYDIDFRQNGGSLVYDVQSQLPRKESFTARDTIFVGLLRKNLVASSIVLRDAAGNVVDPARYQVDTTAGKIRGKNAGDLPRDALFEIQYLYNPVFASSRFNQEDDNPAFDGMRLFVQDAPLGIDSLNSGWLTKNNTNLAGVVQKPMALPSAPFRVAPIDLEVRWNNTDTTARGKWISPGDTAVNNSGKRVVVCPFKIVNVTDTSTFRIMVNGAGADSMWKPGREIVIVTPAKYAPQNPIPVMVGIVFSAPTGTPPIYPTQGNVFQVKTSKPFQAGDKYAFTSTAVRYTTEKARSMLDRIYVVPNPYVAYSSLEVPGSTATQRGDNRLQFRNLPPQCTVRIYTMVGELVDTIVKNDQNSYADWQILSYEGHRLAYGVYLYHVEVPGVGEKIGRLALIK